MTLFPATSRHGCVFSHCPCTTGLGDLAGLLPCSSLLLPVHSPFFSLKTPALNFLLSDCITHIPYWYQCLLVPWPYPFISWRMYLWVYSLILNTISFLILVNSIHMRIILPNMLASEWFELHFQRSRPPPCLTHSLPWECPKVLSALMCITSPYSQSHPGHSLTIPTIFLVLSSSPSLIILHPHSDLQMRWSYYLFPHVLSSLFTQLKFHAHLLVY